MFSNKLLARLRDATNVTVLTGAGISAESGVPTFRGKDGLWQNHKMEELATIQAFQKNPLLFWQFYTWRRKALENIKPNLGHYALVDFERYFKDFTLITQNVDNLHLVAGSKKIIELHGNILRDRCSKCNAFYPAAAAVVAIPTCNKCDALLRPDVVLFGENLNETLLRKAQHAAAECEVFISIGTSGVVEPAASLPFLSKANGAYLVEINEEETPLSVHSNETLRGNAGKILPQMAMVIEKLHFK
jgi:NAD-dependent deacetylase